MTNIEDSPKSSKVYYACPGRKKKNKYEKKLIMKNFS